MVRSATLASLALLVLARPAPSRAADADVPKEPGVYWEQTVEMQMPGFSMPAQTSKVCLPKKGIEEPPRDAREDQKCKMTDLKRSGSRMTWKIKCDDGSSGEGDITSGPDKYDGTMTMRTQGAEMHMKMKGKKVGGDCDANELKRKVHAMQKQADESQAELARGQAKMCEDAAEEMNVVMYVSPHAKIPPNCKDPAKLCARLETRDGLVALKENGGPGDREKVEKLCKKDLGPVISKLCATAAKEQEKKVGGPSTEFVFGYCPDVAKALAKRECAGRKFTALPPQQRDFCTRWAQQKLEDDGGGAVPAKAERRSKQDEESADEDESPKAKKSKKKAVEESAEEETAKPKEKEDMKSKIMKGLFGR